MGLTNYEGAKIIFGAIVGYGILVMPITFGRIGYLGGIFFLFLFGIINLHCIIFLFKAADAIDKDEQNISKVTFFLLLSSSSIYLGDIYNLFMALTNFLATVSFLKTILEMIVKVIDCIIHKEIKKENLIFVALIYSLVQVFFSLNKSIGFLSRITNISILACLYIAFISIYYASKHPEGVIFKKFDSQNIQSTIGTFIFALSCSSIVPYIYNELNEGTSIYIISFSGILMGLLFAIVIGLSGYYSIGSNYNNKKIEDILQYFMAKDTPLQKSLKKSNYKEGHVITVALLFFICLLSCSYAVSIFSSRDCILILFYRYLTDNPPERESNSENILKIFISIVWIFLAAIIAVYFCPDLLVNLNGIYILNFTTFIFPSIAYIKHCKKSNLYLYCMAYLIILFSCLNIVLSTCYIYLKGE